MWDERYDSDDYVYGTQPNDFLKQSAQKLPIGKTLCLGEGEGRNAVYLASLGHQVTAVDASAKGLEKARNLAVQKGVVIETVHADLNDYVIGIEEWDVIVSIFFHVPEMLRKLVHEKVTSGLRKNGIYILEAYTPDQLHYATGGPSVREMMMDMASLEQELKGLTLLHGKELVREIHEGKFHHGMGAVVQLIAMK